MPDETIHVTVDISEGGTAGSVGNVLSSRLPIRYRDENGNVVTGFFTQNEYVNAHQIAATRGEALVRGTADRYPELVDFFNDHKDGRDLEEMTVEFMESAKDLGYNYDKLQYETALGRRDDLKEILEQQILRMGFPQSKLQELEQADLEGDGPNYDDFINNVFALVNNYVRGARLYRTHTNIHAQEDGTNVNRRNDLMSKQAEMLGIGNLVAKSREMTVVQNGQVYQGTFMDTAEGVLRENFHPDTPGFNTNGMPKEMELTLEGFKQICAIQLLDYLAGNVDRHSGNLAYVVDTSDPLKVRIRGVKAYDNDASYGSRTHATRVEKAKTSTLEDLGVIDKALAEKILAIPVTADEKLPEDMMREFHLTGLSETETEYAKARLLNLRDELLKGKDSGVKILDGDEQWQKAFEDRQKLMVNDPEKKASNALYNVSQSIFRYNKGILVDRKPAQPMNYVGFATKVSSLRDAGRLSAYVGRIHELQSDMERDQLVNTKAYNKIGDAIAAMEKLGADLDRRSSRPDADVLRGQLTDRERNAISELLAEIPEQMQKDLEAKDHVRSQQRFTGDTVKYVIEHIRQGIHEDSRIAEQELAQRMAESVRAIDNPKADKVEDAVHKMNSAQTTYIPVKETHHTFATLSARLPKIQSRIRGSSEQFKEMVKIFNAVGDTTNMKNSIQRMAQMNQVADAAQRYLDYKTPNGKTDGFNEYALSHVRFARDLLEYARAGVSQARRDQQMKSELMDVKEFTDRCKQMTARLQNGAGTTPEQIARDKENFLQGYEKLMGVSERYASKQPVQAFCAAACENGTVKAYMDAYTAHLRQTVGKADPNPLKNLGLTEEAVRRQKALSDRAKAAPQKQEAKPAAEPQKAPTKEVKASVL